jgi:hypothetical protein
MVILYSFIIDEYGFRNAGECEDYLRNRLATLCLFTLIAVACGDDDNPLNSGNLAGTYDLEAVTVVFAGLTVVLEPPDAIGLLTMTENRYTATLTFLVPGADGTDSFTESGTYNSTGSAITFTPDGDVAPYSSQLQGNGQQITIASSSTEDDITISVTMVFSKSG